MSAFICDDQYLQKPLILPRYDNTDMILPISAFSVDC